MDNKIVLELIKKDLFELQMMVDMLHKADKIEQMVVELTIRKTESMLTELRMLNVSEVLLGAIPVTVQPEVEAKNEVQPVSAELIELELLSEEPVVAVGQSIAAVEEPAVSAEESIEVIEEPVAETVSQPEPEIEVQVVLPVVEEFVPVEIPEEKPEPVAEIQPEEVILPEPEPVVAVAEELKQEADHHKHKAHAHVKTATEKKVLGEQFSKETSLNERLGASSSQEPNIKPLPIANMRVAIGLNDKFLFTRILFNNDAALFNEALDRIEKSANLREAVDYLNGRFEWEKNDTSLKFIDLLKRRFQN